MSEPKSTAASDSERLGRGREGGVLHDHHEALGCLCGEDRDSVLRPRAQVTPDELRRMPPSLTPSEAMPWTRLSRSAFYKMVAEGDIQSCRLGHSIRIPTRRFLAQLGVLEED